MSHPKRRGDWAELQFMAKAATSGFPSRGEIVATT